MAFCQKCGAQVPDNAQFCAACGAQSAATQDAQPQQSQQVVAPQNDAEENKVMAIVAYIIWFVPLIAGAHKTSPFVKYHTNQGTILFLLALGWGIVSNILLVILGILLFSPIGWGIFGLISSLFVFVYLVPVALAIIGIINAATGKQKPLPVVGGFTIIK